MNTLHIPGKTGKVSDGYHTFDELYEHRCLLFLNLMAAKPEVSWRARRHDDGSAIKGYWVAGMRLPAGDVSYHVPDRMWKLLDRHAIQTLPKAPPWDGHTPADVLRRLRATLSQGAKKSNRPRTPLQKR